MDTKQLKQRILDLAIRGKLVPQDPNDEPASVLLERIRTEKEQLIAQGKLKKSKTKSSDKPHYENVPFEIPDSWEWVTLGELLINRDSERIPLSSAVRKKQTNKIYPYYGAAGVIDKVEKYIFSERLLLIGEDGANLLTRSKDNAFFAEGKYWVNNHAHVLDCSNKIVLDFVAFVINASTLDQYITGSAQPKLSQDNLNRIAIPLPPISEQKRIIEAKNSWFTLIDELEANKEDLKEYIKQVKSKVLDLAIHGKLVPQDPNDEPAIELLKRINPNFKPCDSSHYENLPNGWCVCTLNQLTNIARGGSPRPIKDYITTNENGINWIKIGDTEKNGKYINETKEKIKPEGVCRSRMIHKGDFLLTNSMSFGRPYISNIEGCIHDGWLVISPIDNVYDKEFLYYLLSSSYAYNQFSEKASGTAVSNLNVEKVANALFPLPPLAEQKRIAEQIETIFASLDTITAEL